VTLSRITLQGHFTELVETKRKEVQPVYAIVSSIAMSAEVVLGTVGIEQCA